MTDTIITRDEAIERMRKGEPCETQNGQTYWVPTLWLDFENVEHKFRIPPEPGKSAMEFAIWDFNGMWRAAQIRNRNELNGAIHVREVLPDEVVVRRMTEEEALVEFDRWANGYDLNYEPNYSEATRLDCWAAFLESRRTLGLIADK